MLTVLAFLGVSALVIVTPGPDTAMAIRNTLLGGRRGGVATALGIAAGQTIWAVATSLGLVAVLIASEPIFLAVKYAGAAYLVYLGVRALLEALRPSSPASAPVLACRPDRLAAAKAFRQGVVSNLGNPKMAVFFASLLPQFAPAGQPSVAILLTLGIVFAAMTCAWLTLYAVLISMTADVLRRPAIRRAIEAVSGTVLIGLGLRIATEPR